MSNQTAPCILVVDGNSILNRAFYGIRPLTNKDGLFTQAVYGMANIMLKHLNELTPAYAVAAFDLKGPTFRHERYAQYKAGAKACRRNWPCSCPMLRNACVG